ncbi:glutamine synthetase family protein [Actinoplanes regularis]|uniref:L-glutamine synthetase n=1 Tax=Actinoplanes regularis TaxID=52697 RepID=A0A238YSL9_9ACTN|nr:glutamine synthetase family protein [Actinoplanes regularis]GIE85532.1 glutamine synthetase [Actinoplanes regularis]SNR74115.1 L-glutamine synthetase [Actinoplanes regularis]
MPGVLQLRERGVRGVILSYVDTAGINRIKTVPLSRLEHAVQWGVGISPVFDVFLADDSTTSTDRLGGPDGDLRLRPDLDRLVVLAGQPGWAWAPADRFTQEGEPWIADQRGFTRRMVSRAAAEGLSFRTAIEVEWAVGRDEDDFVAACRGPAYGMTRLVELSDYARDVLIALEEQGVQVEQLHPEYAAGQFEVSIAATDPLGAADDNVLVRQTIRAVSHRHGLRASFAPVVLAGRVGNGGHVHLSAWRDGANLFTGFPSSAGGFAAAGILAHLPALLAVGAPTPASYLRLVPSRWAGAFACWGVETRETALRFVPGTAGLAGAANLEVKCFDLTANPYLLLGALVAAALDGLAGRRPLPEPVAGDPTNLPDAPRLPTTLDAAVDAFAADETLREALGTTLFDAVVAVRRAEAARFRDADPEEVAAALRWVY